MAFADLQDDMDNAEAYVKSVVGAALAECPDELEFFAKFYDKTLLEKLQARAIRDAQFGRAIRNAQFAAQVAAQFAAQSLTAHPAPVGRASSTSRSRACGTPRR